MSKKEETLAVALTTIPIAELRHGKSNTKERKVEQFMGMISHFIDSDQAVHIHELEQALKVKLATMKTYAREKGIKLMIRRDDNDGEWAIFTKK